MSKREKEKKRKRKKERERVLGTERDCVYSIAALLQQKNSSNKHFPRKFQ